jgi:hypothetical protein
MFPIVELALALNRWVEVDMPHGTAFDFVSAESDESGFVWFRPEGTGWRVGSIHQEFADMSIWSSLEVTTAVGHYIREVEHWLDENVGVAFDSLGN